MKILLHRDFEKSYLKLTLNQKKKFKDRRTLFLQDQFNPILNNHSLKGEYLGCRSINVTGDLRIIYKKFGDDIVFITIGSHSNWLIQPRKTRSDEAAIAIAMTI